MGPEGFEPSPFGLKVRCAAVTPQPQIQALAYPFASPDDRHRVAPVGSKFEVRGSPGNRTQRHPVISRVRATSPRLPCKSGVWGSNPDPPVPKTGVLPSAPPPDLSVRTVGLEPTISWPPAKRDTKLRYVLIFSDPCGSRTQPDRLERPMTSPEVERAALLRCARTGCAEWAGRRSNPRLRFFRPPLYRLSYQPKLSWGSASSIGRSQRKRPACRCDTGPCGSSKSKTKCQQRLCSLGSA